MAVKVIRYLTTSERKRLKRLLDGKRESGILIYPQRAINNRYRISFVLYPKHLNKASYMYVKDNKTFFEAKVFLEDNNILDKPISVTTDKEELVVNVI